MHGSAMFPMRQHGSDITEVSMLRWMCGFQLKERKRNVEVRELLGQEPATLVVKRSRLR